MNVAAGHLKRCGGPHLARERLFALPWSIVYYKTEIKAVLAMSIE